MKKALETKLSRHGVIIDEFNIENFQFSESFNVAVEAKVSAEQQALAAKNKLEQIKFEAQQKIESAKGSAEAIRIEADALYQNPAVLQLRAIEKWDGVLPKVTSEAIPFINIE
jgi:regulator of protease activity HflC (stomatin/prohibitin superfamily)